MKEVLGKLIDPKKAAVLKVLLGSSEELCLKEIANKSGVPMTSTFRILQELAGQEIIQKREWKTSKVYACREDEHNAFLKELFHDDFVEEFMKGIAGLEGIQQVLLHGSQGERKANILLIGQAISIEPVEEIAEKIRRRGFELSVLPLAPQQYSQMIRMGIYSGKEKKLR